MNNLQYNERGYHNNAINNALNDPRLRVSIVIPVYNRIVYLGKTIESVLSQTYTNWELWVIDDGSHEDVRGLVQCYKDPRINFRRYANHGNAVARNTGIEHSKGEYIICLDSDDIWHPEMLQVSVTILHTYSEVDVVYTQFQQIDGEGRTISKPPEPDPRNGNLLVSLLMGYPILPSSALVRRRCFERWGMYTPGLDDWELWLRWAARGCRFLCIEQALIYYRVHKENFNLDWMRRHKIHFAMLDTFYRCEDVPPNAKRIRNRVYANQHLNFSVLAWQVGRPDDGMTEFSQAVLTNPDLLADIDFYTKIACSHQDRLEMGTIRNLNFDSAQRILFQSLDKLFMENNLPKEIYKRRSFAYGWAYLTLARLAYSVPHDKIHSLKFFLKSIIAYPPILWCTDWVVWLARAVIGYQTLQYFKRIYKHP